MWCGHEWLLGDALRHEDDSRTRFARPTFAIVAHKGFRSTAIVKEHLSSTNRESQTLWYVFPPRGLVTYHKLVSIALNDRAVDISRLLRAVLHSIPLRELIQSSSQQHILEEKSGLKSIYRVLYA